MINLIQTIKDIYAILYWNIISKRKPTRLRVLRKRKELNIILNGPSSREYLQHLSNQSDIDKNVRYMVVNFFALEWKELFHRLTPRYYVAIDPYYATCHEWVEELETIDWKMTLIVNPNHFYKFKNPNIRLFFLSPIEIVKTNQILYTLHMNNLCNLSLSNVSCAAIMEGIRRNFKKIYLYGLDYDYCLNLSVDIKNHLHMNNIRHSYAGERNIDLHDEYPKIVDMWENIGYNFNSFYILEKYAHKKGIQIINRNPNSLVDAFTKIL